jgi:hypothetical protein
VGSEQNIIELLLSRINQVCYSRLFSQMHKQYNYLQSILKQKLLTKNIRKAEQHGLGFRNLRSCN